MAAELSTGLRNAWLGVSSPQSLQSLLNLCFIYVYSGTPPTTADAAATGMLLVKMSVNGDGVTGGTWEDAVNGALAKTAAEVWEGTIAVSGEPGYFRICVGSDNNTSSSSTAYRWQDTAGGAGSALEFTDTNFVAGNSKGISLFSLQIPA